MTESKRYNRREMINVVIHTLKGNLQILKTPRRKTLPRKYILNPIAPEPYIILRFKPNFYKIVTIRHRQQLNFYHKEPHINLINIKDNNNNKININNDNNSNNNNNNKINSKQFGCDLIIISLVYINDWFLAANAAQ